MLYQKRILLTSGVLLFALVPLFGAEDETTKAECPLSDIKTSVSVALEIIEAAMKKLPTDLKELCRKTSNITECKIVTHDENICECKNVTHDVNITECKDVTDDANITKNKNVTRDENLMDCSDFYKKGYRKDGVYEIWLQGGVSKGPLQVYCDMESNGGGWTVLQRRGDYKSPEDYFYRGWGDYKKGFGDIEKDFWIGNDNIFALTNQRSYQLRVNLSDWEGNSTYATYDEFSTSDEIRNYTLHLEGYHGTAGNSFIFSNGKGFYTKDRDSKGGCAVKEKGAWWYDNCGNSNLNGLYLKGKTDSYGDMVYWYKFRGARYSLKDAVMKIRPSSFRAKAID